MTETVSSKRRKLTMADTSTEPSRAAAVEVIVNNSDLLAEILLRLPAKSLLRLRCVSKHWLSLISDPRFAVNHSSRQNPRPSITGLYFCRNPNLDIESFSLDGSPTTFPSLDFIDGGRSPRGQSLIKIMHSCNGLLLCDNLRIVADGHFKVRYIVCNPTTQKYRVIIERGHDDFYASGCLAFDPLKSPHYKVLLVSRRPSPCLEIDIYSSESAYWTKIFPVEIGCGGGVYWNGAINWLCDSFSRLRFDVETEKMIEIPYPSRPKILSVDKILYFGESRGRLLLIQARSRSAMEFKILEMDKDKCGWIAKCQVNLKPLISAFPRVKSLKYNKFAVFFVVKGEKEKDFTLVLAMPGKIISYNTESEMWNVLCEMGPYEVVSCNPKRNGHAISFPFVETLCPV